MKIKIDFLSQMKYCTELIIRLYNYEFIIRHACLYKWENLNVSSLHNFINTSQNSQIHLFLITIFLLFVVFNVFSWSRYYFGL
jgi:hypothetical protein